MGPNKKTLLIIIGIIITGSFGTILSAHWYYNSTQQENISYNEIPFQRGMSFTTWGVESFNSTEAHEEILEMKEIDIEWVGVNIWWTQESVDATKIEDGDWTDTAANITALFKFIHSNGMKVLFKPMLDSEDGVWRSYIEASPKWIKEYNRFIKYTAEIAENGSVDVFCIGCEMGNWQVKTDVVRELIKEVREIYSGDLTYAANHDSFWYIDWWDAVDIIGIDAYFSFTLSYDPTLQDMIAVWDGFYDELHKFQKKWNRPILFTEIGCQNRDGCNIAPNDNKFNLNQDEKEFRMFYKSLFESKIWSAPWFKGTYWWIWDLREIDEDDDNGFTPQLSIIQDTIQKYYSGGRNVIYPNYFLELIIIFVLGSLITAIATLSFKYSRNISKERILEEEGPIQESLDELTAKRLNPLAHYALINGILFGCFLFWAFTYYNQILFNMLYSIVTKSIFLGGGIIFIIISIFLTILCMLLIWVFLQRTVYKRRKQRNILISNILITCAILIFILEVFLYENLSNQISMSFFFTLQIMIILGILFTFTMFYCFPYYNVKELENKRKNRLYLITTLEIVGFSALILLMLSLLLKISLRAPSIVIGIILVLLTPIINKNVSDIIPQFEFNMNNSLDKEATPRWQLKFLEASICIFALGYYFGVLRYFDNHNMINFNLSLLPNFLIPIGFSILFAILIIIGAYYMIKTRSIYLEKKLNVKTQSNNEILSFLLKGAILFSFPLLILGGFFTPISYEIALLSGGIPLVIIFSIFIIGNLDSNEIFKENRTWKRMTVYLVVILTIAFSANGAMVGLLYALTFLTIKDGQIVVEIAFEEELGFDAIQMIYNIQLIIALTLIVISLILIKYVVPKIKK